MSNGAPFGIVCGTDYMRALDPHLADHQFMHISSLREATAARDSGVQLMHVLSSGRPKIQICGGDRTIDGTAGPERAAEYINNLAASLRDAAD